MSSVDTYSYPACMTNTEKKVRLVGRDEAAEIGGVSTRTITRYVKTGLLTPYRDVPGRVRFSEAQVREVFRYDPDHRAG